MRSAGRSRHVRLDRLARRAGHASWRGLVAAVRERADLAAIAPRLADIPQWREAGGGGATGCCPFHDDRNPSFSIVPGGRGFRCHSTNCGVHGDQIRFVQMATGCGFADAVAQLADMCGLQAPDIGGNAAKPKGSPKAGKASARPSRRPRMPMRTPPPAAGPDADGSILVWNARHERSARWRPRRVWRWRGGDGSLLALTVRFDDDDGRKVVLPLTWRVAGGRGRWVARGWPHGQPRPIWGMDRLGAACRRIAAEGGRLDILLVEGEKAAERAAELLPEPWVALTAMGGGSAVAGADWKAVAEQLRLAGTDAASCRIAIWPDADVPTADRHPARSFVTRTIDGLEAAMGGHSALARTAALHAVWPHPKWPDGFDVGDLPLTAECSAWALRQIDLAARLGAGEPRAHPRAAP